MKPNIQIFHYLLNQGMLLDVLDSNVFNSKSSHDESTIEKVTKNCDRPKYKIKSQIHSKTKTSQCAHKGA